MQELFSVWPSIFLRLATATHMAGYAQCRMPSSPGSTLPPPSQVMLGYLRSYEGLGSARMSCSANCACAPAQLQGLWAQRYSAPDYHAFNVTPHTDCRIQVHAWHLKSGRCMKTDRR